METAIIVALIGLVGTLLALMFNRRGSREAAEQAQRANELKEREADWQRRGDIIKDLTAEIDRLRAAKRAAQESCALAQANSLVIISLLSEAVERRADRAMAQRAIEEANEHGKSHDV